MICSCWSPVGAGDSLDISGVVSGREGSRESGHTASLHMQQHSLKTEAQWSSPVAGYSQAVFHWRELEGWMSLDLQAVFKHTVHPYCYTAALSPPSFYYI
ncbi:unnamed protein product [Arctogadus glacialis]